MNKLVFAAFFTLVTLFVQGQVTGTVLSSEDNQALQNVKIMSSDGQKTLTNYAGEFTLAPAKFPVKIIVSMIQFVNDTIVIKSAGPITILLKPRTKDETTVVVSAGKRKQAIEEIPVSMEIIKPQLIDNKGITDLEQAVDQTPGVNTMDGQVSIRGGSGFAYGTGSRVLLLWNGMPLLSGYAGDTQWNAIPMEQAAQIEVMKGASSVLYGSGALNGVIALAEKEPKSTPETKIKIQNGIYGDPARASLKWWNKSPMFQQVEAYHSKMNRYTGYTISTTFFKNDGYRQGEIENRGRVSGTIYFRPKTATRLKAGLGFNYQAQKTGSFLIWQSDSLGYIPSGGADTSNAASTLTYNLGQRLFIDPYVKFIDKKNNLHHLKTRVYYAHNANINNPSQSNGAVIYFADYSIQKQFKNGGTLTSGASNIYNVVKSNLFGDHHSENLALYSQLELHKGKWDFSAGARLEYFQMDGKTGDTDFMISEKKNIKIPFYPILRTGIHYQAAKFTHLRASFGQGIRYPSVAERYTQTSVGALNIFPNPYLTPEIGWAGEIGIKQGVKIGSWKGFIDLAAFVNQYSNMMEFTFGLFNPSNIPLSNDPGNPGYIYKWIGFQAQNVEKARISGLDLSFNSMGKIGEVELISLLGYTYMNPISLNKNTNYSATFSDTTTNMLKYRFKHLAKADIEANYLKWGIGASLRYNSFMSNIDKVFEEPIAGSTYILPGLKEYRQKYDKGNLVFDARIAYKITDNFRVSFIVNNVFNAEYSSRPGDIQPPRNFIAQLQMKF
jgi:outer membrane receptor protein involved in Fe transport